ncbi:MAG: peptidoglycan DD-metalloendopeptidase family protein [Gammaproteobacteria bacterium]|nr:peptidoglycan DD-metalloendopeptidase family protein [Gammaproteobacteria bacterium]MDH3858387.1 peptidoglycan DD-metalloendopeptidase family protein [Gammaproteobacteria bacterium]
MSFADFIKDNRDRFAPMFEPVLSAENTVYMELSSATNAFEGLSEAEIDRAVFQRIDDAGAIAGVGGYLENRAIYRNTELFRGDEERCIHIGVDVFMPAGTLIYAPLAGEVHSFANRQVSGDYGPVIILRHRLDDFEFHSLYGHLAEASLEGLYDGKAFASGEKITEIGPRPVNGNWTPHLHFQLIQDMQDYHGDYPGVVRPADLDFFKRNCPDPSVLIVG